MAGQKPTCEFNRGKGFKVSRFKVLTLKGFLGALRVSAVKKVHATAADAANCGA
jgi:hypothetical protein